MDEWQEQQLIRHIESIAEWLGVDFQQAMQIWHEEEFIGYDGILEKYKDKAKKRTDPGQTPLYYSGLRNRNGEAEYDDLNRFWRHYQQMTAEWER